MKIVFIILILIIIYLVFRQIKVYPKKEKTVKVENFDVSEKRPINYSGKKQSLEKPTYFAPSESVDYKEQRPTSVEARIRELPSSKRSEDCTSELPSAREFMRLVQEEHLNTQYKFNVATQPVTTIVPNRYNEDTQSRYLDKIRKFVDDWNQIFDDYYGIDRKQLKVKDINLLFIQETMTEFVIRANVRVVYQGKPLHMRLSFYGWIDRSDEPHFGEKDHYYMQMFDLAPISSDEYGVEPTGHSTSWDDTFSSYDRDRKYAKKIREMHQKEHFMSKLH